MVMYPTKKLGEVSINFDTKRIPIKESERKKGKYPYYGASGIVDYIDDYIFDGEYLLIAEDGENLRTRNTPVAFKAKSKFWVNNHAHIIKGNDKALTKYLEYAVNLSDISSYLTGTTMPKLTQANMNRIPVSIPPIEIQHKIVRIIGTVDDKIDLNNQLNKTLEAIAKAIFKEWFIDFGPVRAKAEGRRPFGMDDETAALFPDSFEDSELGPIPKGWKIVELDTIADVLNGFAFKSADYKESGIFVLRTKNFNEQGFANSLQDDVFLSEEKAKEYDSYYVQPFDIHLIMVAASIGKTSITPPCILPALRNQNMWCFRNKSNFPYRHNLNLIVPIVSENLKGFSSGSARDFFRKGDFQKYKITLPTNDLLKKSEKIIRSLYEMIAFNIEENILLTQTRDLLLPKLISGEISLSNNDISTISNETTTHIPPIQQKIYAYTKNEGKINM